MAFLTKCLGLITYYNEIGEYTESLRTADNVNVDAPDIITPRRGFRDYGSPLMALSDRLKQLIIYKNIILRHYNETLQFESSPENFTDFNSAVIEPENGIRIKSQEANGNLYFTTSEGVKKISAKNAAQINANSIQKAGGIRATSLTGNIEYTPAGFLPKESKVAYRLLFGTKDNNNNLILGYPSERFVLTNFSADIKTSERSQVTFAGAQAASDYFILTLPDLSKYVVYFDTTGTDPAPKYSDTVGGVYVKIDFSSVSTNLERATILANDLLTSIAGITTSVVGGNTTNIVNNVPGDTIDIVAGTKDMGPSAGLTNATVATVVQGSIMEGQSASVLIKSILPQGLNTNYFYQLYRTPVFSASEDLFLDEIEPGDDMYLVIEEPISSVDITNGFIEVLDDTPENFRASGTPLYTSPNIGEGILRANEIPPLCKDITMFKNSMFFANTSVAHRIELNLLTVNDITSDTTEFFVGNSNLRSSYVFVGEAEDITIEVDTTSNTTPSSWILINSANDLVRYYLVFKTTAGDSDPDVGLYPELEGAQKVDVNLYLYPDTIAGSRDALNDALGLIIDFETTVVGDDVNVVNAENGPSTDAALGAVSPGGAWNITKNNDGRGENIANQEVLLSKSASPAVAIEITAKSLVNNINQDPNSPVNAYYISGSADLPGKILLEARTLSNDPFYVATNDATAIDSFSPNLNEVFPISAVTFSSGSNSPANINAAGHGLNTGDELYIVNPNTTPVIQGVYEITVVDVDNFTIPLNITVEDDPATNSFYFLAQNPSDNLTLPNRLYFSKVNQPEAVPLLNYLDIGPKDEPIERILALRDTLFVFKTDGIYTISGTTEPNFTFRLIDNNAILIAPDSAVVLNNLIYGLTTQGVVMVNESSPGIISRVIENKINDASRPEINFRTLAFGVAYERDRSYILWLPQEPTDTFATQAYRYNTFEKTWTRWTKPATCGIVSIKRDRLYIGSGNENLVLEERKAGNRTDYSDKDFTLQIGVNPYNQELKRLKLSNIQNVAEGDVICQEQYITVEMFNRLLRNLDIDKGYSDTFIDTLQMYSGDNITNKVQSLNNALVSEDASITPFIASSDPETLRTQLNSMIEELNDAGSLSTNKNYKILDYTVPYEAVIEGVLVLTNEVVLQFDTPFIQGDVQVFKPVPTIVEWNPQTFGDPSVVKQVRTATVIFDQTNFTKATVSFSSDLSQEYQSQTFYKSGPGYYGYGIYGGLLYYYGGTGNDSPYRTYPPREKQRCRYLNIKLEHKVARETYKIVGISADVRPVSTRGYRS